MMTEDYRLVVLGLGYVGLTLAAVNAQAGFSVLGVDINEDIIDGLNEGKPHFHENGLPELLAEAKCNLVFSTNIEAASDKKSVYVIAVGTSLASDGSADYAQIDSSTAMIGSIVKPGDIIILRSTVIVGTTRNRVIPALEASSGLVAGKDFEVGFAPERTIEGRAIDELRTLPQIVAASTKSGAEKIEEFFDVVSEMIVPVDTLEAAEMVKLVSNAYRDITFAFANSVALAASEHNVDVGQLIHAANKGYERNSIPLPSPGVGGYCLTKDPYLFAQGGGSGKIYDFIHAGREINAHMPLHLGQLVKSYAQKQLEIHKVHVVIVGLAFKGEPATSDIRFSPSIELVKHLQSDETEYAISAYDPHVHETVYEKHNITKLEHLAEVLEVGDVIIFMHGAKGYAEHAVVEALQKRGGTQLLIDTWGLFKDQLQDRQEGVDYANLSYKSF